MHWQGTSNKNSAWGLSLVLAVGVCCLAACVEAGSAPQKRLIGHGWDLLGVSPVEVARHADALRESRALGGAGADCGEPGFACRL